MITSLIERRLRAAEAKGSESLDFLRDIARSSLAAFAKFALFLPLAAHRAQAPAQALAVARLVAVKHEECGPCLQTVVDQSLRTGVAAETIRAVLADAHEGLSEDLADVYVYAHAVVNREPAAESYRARLLERYDQSVIVELALAIASVRVFPTVKRGLGYARSCVQSRTDV